MGNLVPVDPSLPKCNLGSNPSKQQQVNPPKGPHNFLLNPRGRLQASNSIHKPDNSNNNNPRGHPQASTSRCTSKQAFHSLFRWRSSAIAIWATSSTASPTIGHSSSVGRPTTARWPIPAIWPTPSTTPTTPRTPSTTTSPVI